MTFFRTRPTLERANPSAFAARQLLIAHAAVSDPERGRLWHDQRIARAGFGLAEADEGRTAVWIRDWSLVDDGRGGFVTRVHAGDFAYDLRLERTQPPLLNGEAGYSRKGADPRAASWYYSLPQLGVSGTVTRAGRTDRVRGRAWLDHEWASAFLEEGAIGWDWVGINLADGGALMAFRTRDADGRQRWGAATLRTPAGDVRTFAPEEVEWRPGRTWRSPRTGNDYPVEWRVRVGELDFELVPLMDDQESDSRLTTGAVYWEGAVTARRAGRELGRGYLELTGYGAPLQLP